MFPFFHDRFSHDKITAASRDQILQLCLLSLIDFDQLADRLDIRRVKDAELGKMHVLNHVSI